jgi:hypothetical protein
MRVIKETLLISTYKTMTKAGTYKWENSHFWWPVAQLQLQKGILFKGVKD